MQHEARFLAIGRLAARGRTAYSCRVATEGFFMTARISYIDDMAFPGASGSGHPVAMDGAPEYGGLGTRA